MELIKRKLYLQKFSRYGIIYLKFIQTKIDRNSAKTILCLYFLSSIFLNNSMVF